MSRLTRRQPKRGKMKRKLRLTRRQGIVWSIGLLLLAISLFGMAEYVFGIKWAEIGKEQMGMLCFSLAGLFFVYAIWLMIKTHFKLGEPYNIMRTNLEVLRIELRKVERSQECDMADFERSVEKFNECARMLGVKEYE